MENTTKLNFRKGTPKAGRGVGGKYVKRALVQNTNRTRGNPSMQINLAFELERLDTRLGITGVFIETNLVLSPTILIKNTQISSGTNAIIRIVL